MSELEFSGDNPMARSPLQPQSSMKSKSRNAGPPPPPPKRETRRPPVSAGEDSQRSPSPRTLNSTRYQMPADESKDLGEEEPSKSPRKKNLDVVDIEVGEVQLKKGDGTEKRSEEKRERSVRNKEEDTGRTFKGKNIIQYGVLGHYMNLGSSFMMFTLGIFAIIWTGAHTYHCKLGDKYIHSSFLEGTCTQSYQGRPICCTADTTNTLKDLGNINIGALYILYSIMLFFYENVDYGFGLWFPTDSFFYRNRLSPIGIANIIAGIVGLANDATALAGGCVITAGVVYSYAAYRFEGGDGGRAQRKKNREAAANTKAAQAQKAADGGERAPGIFDKIWEFNPVSFYLRIYNEDKLSSYIWVFIFILINVILFAVTLLSWFGIVDNVASGLMDGTLKIDCKTAICRMNRKTVRYGPLSSFAPWAKAAGNCLNMDGSLILLPVIKNLLRRLNNSGVSFSNARTQTDYFAKFFARPLTRYIPLQKNIEFHKMCALAVFFFAYLHMVMHYFNLITADAATVQVFRFARWGGTQYFLGSLVTYAMFIIYSGAPEAVRHAKYENFFRSHHFFIIFFLVMFIHGPNFLFWSILPVLLYILERYLQLARGNRPYLIQKVEYIEPVLAVYFRPVFKEDFEFKEGQYLLLNCPYISTTEWHPFTISSAHDDLLNGPRINLETGEEVVEVPRPSNLAPGVKWNKFCPQSKDWRTVPVNDYLDKSETGFMDYVSVHIKVQGLDEPYARTWTRKLKEYFELLSPGGKFPFYFSRRDPRGEVQIGRQYGPDGKSAIIRVDGPHSAPAEHYTNYGTVMLIGAGIGLTPCASILCALTKYRWKKNFSPEILHFYWIVRQNEVDSFQWLVHMLTDLSFELKRGQENNQIERRYYCEVNIYVTGVDKTPKEVRPLYRGRKDSVNFGNSQPAFTADQLYAAMLNPTVESKGQVKKMKAADAANRFQDVWIWNGRPYWDEVFKDMKEQRQHSDIGVCFCGAPVIGADLRAMCEKYSSIEDDCLFSLHKENF